MLVAIDFGRIRRIARELSPGTRISDVRAAYRSFCSRMAGRLCSQRIVKLHDKSELAYLLFIAEPFPSGRFWLRRDIEVAIALSAAAARGEGALHEAFSELCACIELSLDNPGLSDEGLDGDATACALQGRA